MQKLVATSFFLDQATHRCMQHPHRCVQKLIYNNHFSAISSQYLWESTCRFALRLRHITTSTAPPTTELVDRLAKNAAAARSPTPVNNNNSSNQNQQKHKQKQRGPATIVKRLPHRPNVARRWEKFDAEQQQQQQNFAGNNNNSADATTNININKSPPLGLLTVYATAEEYDIEKLEQSVLENGIYSRIDLPEELRAHAVHFESRYPVDEEPREFYLFQQGYVAFWNVQPSEIRTLLATFRQFETASYDSDLIQQESEQMNFMFHKRGGVKINPARGLLCLEDGASHERNDLVKYVFSNATGQSAKLGMSESLVEKFSDKIETIAETLRSRGGHRMGLSRRDLMQLSGQVFMFRHKLNVDSAMASTPDVYWEHEWLEALYAEAARYFSITQRVRVTNDTLGYCGEVLDLVRDDLNNSYSHRLEILIIILIMIEVLFECAHFGRDYYNKTPTSPNKQHETI